MIDAIRLTFAALREAGHAEPGRLSVRGVDGGPSGPRLGLDADGRSHLLVEADADAEIIPGISAITRLADGISPSHLTRATMSISCARSSSSPRCSTTSSRRSWSGRTTAPAISHGWCRMSSIGGAASSRRWALRHRVTLSQAVVGELLLLRDVANGDAVDVLSAWVGPRGGRHDVRRGLCAVEVDGLVPSTTARSWSMARISCCRPTAER